MNVARWKERLGYLPADGVAGHGYPPRAIFEATVDEAVRDVVEPGFAHLGMR